MLRVRGEGEMQGRERNERARERSGAVLGASGEARASRGEGTQAAAVARMRAVCGDHAPCPSGARRGTTGAGQSAGPACWARPGRR